MKLYNKLVRDRIPEIIEKKGGKCETRILDKDEYTRALREKLREEVLEYETDGGVEELADIMEVVRALAYAEGADERELERVRALKKEERGGFENRVFLVSAE